MINKGRETESSYIMLEVKSIQPCSKHKKKSFSIINRQPNTDHVIIWYVLLITLALTNNKWAIDARACLHFLCSSPPLCIH